MFYTLIKYGFSTKLRAQKDLFTLLFQLDNTVLYLPMYEPIPHV